MIRVLGIHTTLKEGWKDLLPGPKMGNLKDPEKIKAKEEEYWATAEETAKYNPMTLTVDNWVGLTLEGNVEDQGVDPISLGKYVSHIHTVYGYKIRRILKAISFIGFSRAEKIPLRFWYNHPMPGLDTAEFAFDPIDMLISGIRTDVSEEDIRSMLGIPETPQDPLEQAQWCSTIVNATIMRS